ncbi:hypothetical protein IU505_35190, partial [Nocardia nova]|nr:hypothetical protein [Nocardia nova]
MRADTRALPRLRLVALISGLLAVVLAVLRPILPIEQDRPTLHWPQG